MTNVLVLGATGMLGSMVLDWLHRDPALHIRATCRSDLECSELQTIYPQAILQHWDAEGQPPQLDGVDWVINAVGVIKPHIQESKRGDVARALRINALMPLRLAEEAERTNVRIIQIATDCVYSGRDGCYSEAAPHDATDVYGKSKSLGEVSSPNVTHLRCSIVGPEIKGFHSLLSWFLAQPKDAEVKGFTNHAWNGVTTLHFAKLAGAIARGLAAPPTLLHVVPHDDVAKATLLKFFADSFHRPDIRIRPTEATSLVDRRLRTTRVEENETLWRAAGYPAPPSIQQMVAELGAYPFRS